MTSLELVAPTADLADSYRGMVQEFADRGEAFVPFVLSFAHADFAGLLADLRACARGEGPAKGWVPHSTYWLVRNGAEVVAVTNLRHRLTSALQREGGNIGYGVRPSARRQGLGVTALRETLGQARSLGLSEALLTCARTNVGSIRVILHNGGVLASEEYLAERGEVVHRYRVPIPAAVRG